MFLSYPQYDEVNECLWQWRVTVNMTIILDIVHFFEIFQRKCCRNFIIFQFK